MTLFDEILYTMFIVVMLGVMLSLVLIFIMHILMPKIVLKTYFKEPYFSSTEITMFTGIPFGYMRTTMFMRALGFPSSGKKRGIEDAYKIAPVWYCKASRYLVLFIVPLAVLLLLLIIIGTIHFELWK
ncbi:MAG: hypothetical protein GXP17_07045 [Gammaproteobacteria bacterium]|nr:hypothetical protein [Gammaproteobacteria bacterium]